MANGSITLPLPANTHIKITGLTNSGWWGQQITIQPPSGGQELTWTGTGAQDNQIIGQCSIGPYSTAEEGLTVGMSYDNGSGWQPSAVQADAYNLDGLSGYVVGGQDGGGRPNGPAFWNTVVLIYWAAGY